ncbi:hypothetical protein FRB97_006049, partial [Tulasnella sp. 331]
SCHGLLYDRESSVKRRRFVSDVDLSNDNNHTTKASDKEIAATQVDDESKGVSQGVDGDESSEDDCVDELEAEVKGLEITKPQSNRINTTARRTRVSGSLTPPPLSDSVSTLASSSSSSAYTPINSLLSELNDIRMRKAQQTKLESPARRGTPQSVPRDTLVASGAIKLPPRSTTPSPMPVVLMIGGRTTPRAPDTASQRGRLFSDRLLSIPSPHNIPHLHSPAVSSPLRQSISRLDSYGSSSAGTLVPPSPSPTHDDEDEKESEAVRTRYEDINRLLGSLALSRRRMQ